MADILDLFGTFNKVFNPPETISSVRRKSDSFSGGGLRYPLETEYPAYIQYRVKEVIPPSIQAAGDIIGAFKPEVPKHLQSAKTDIRTGNQNAVAEKNISIIDDLQNRAADINQKSKSANTGLLGFKTVYKNDLIKLYFPQAVQVNDQVQYENQNLGTTGAVGLNALNSGASISEAIARGAMETGNSLMNLFGVGNNSGIASQSQAARLAAAKAASLGAVQAFTPAGAQAALGIALQVKVNPSTRSIFTGVTVRNFTFTYDFHASSQREADMINRIIKRFRTIMYPRAIPEQSYREGLPLGYEFPDLFEIEFKYNNSKIQMPQPLLCYLRDVSTSYNPGSMSFHSDGNPTHIQMSLSFQEFRALNQQDIEKGH